MATIVKEIIQVEMPNTFTSKKVNMMEHVQLNVIPEEHKIIVRERIKKYEKSPDSYLSWDDIERKMAARQPQPCFLL